MDYGTGVPLVIEKTHIDMGMAPKNGSSQIQLVSR